MPAQLIFTVHELIVTAEAAGAGADGAALSVRLEPADRTLVDGAPPTTEPRTPAHGGAARFDWSHTIDVFPGGRAWDALHRALGSEGEEDSDIYFNVLGASGAGLGEAYVNLEQLLASGMDVEREHLKVLGPDSKVVGRLTVSVQAIAALKLVKSGGGGGLASMILAAAGKTAYGGMGASPAPASLSQSQPAALRLAAPFSGRTGSFSAGSAAPKMEEEQLVFTIHELIVPADTPGATALSVRLEPEDKALVGGAPPQTEQRSAAQGGAARFDWSHTVDVLPGTQAWEALHRALCSAGEEDSDVYFNVIGESGASLGEAYVNFERIFASGNDLSREDLEVLDADNKVVY